MNVKLMRAVMAGTAVLGVALGGHSAQAATASANAKARVLQVVTVTKSADLDFGTIVPAATASNVQMTAANVFTCGTGLTCTLAHAPAAFNVTGTTGEVVTLASDATAALSNGAGGSMNVSALAPSASTLTLAATGNNFRVGGTLAVGANQAEGSYTGAFNVTVNYQ